MRPRQPSPPDPPLGIAFLTAVLPALAGLIQSAATLSALTAPGVCATAQAWSFQLETARWAWFHLALGILLTGVGMPFTGRRTRGRVGTGLAAVHAVVSYFWLPWYPVRGATMIALDVLIIWLSTVCCQDRTSA